MKAIARLSCLLLATALLGSGCGKGQPEGAVSPQQAFDEFAMALAGFKDELSAEEELVSEDVIAGLGEVRGSMNQLIELCAEKPELEATLKSITETLDQLESEAQTQIDRAKIRQGITKVEEQSGSLRQQLAGK